MATEFATAAEQTRETPDLGDRLDRIACELYQQINFLEDIAASSEAAGEALSLIENESLDDNFARVNGELLSTADQVATGCERSLKSCLRARDILEASIRAYRQISDTVKRLSEASQQIQNVAGIIDSFAQQTGMVAINAQIEAAHAGQFGRGFAVVAQQVSNLANQIKNESKSIAGAVGGILGAAKDTSTLLDEEIARNREQETAVQAMIAVNESLQEKGKSLPQMVTRLDQFLDPLERARGAVGHNQMIQVATGNLARNVRSLHGALRSIVRDQGETAAACTIEQFVDSLAESMTIGREVPIEQMLQRLLDAGHDPLRCLDACGKAVQAANMRQKHQHVSVGDYYLNYLIVERAMAYLDEHIGEAAHRDMKVVLGNARGDYHSLGRQMVGLFLKASGIEVIDVGLGAAVEAFVDAAARSGAKVIGVSSLLIESAKEIAKIRAALDKRGMTSVKIVAGGACFTVDRELYREVRADFVATAASDMVSIVEQVYEYAPLSEEVAS